MRTSGWGHVLDELWPSAGHDRAPSAAVSRYALNSPLKRGFDVCLAGAGLVLVSPLLLAIALVIKATSQGPVMFRQARIGWHGRQFEILKFRTLAGNGAPTAIGRLLRRSSLDELPQLINVLGGEMSMVGPRPHVPEMLACGVPYEQIVPEYDERLAVRPGITGLAQASGLRGPVETEAHARARVACDLRYIETASLWGDIVLIGRTLRRELLRGTGS